MEFLFILVLVLWGLHKFLKMLFQNHPTLENKSDLLADYWAESDRLKQSLGRVPKIQAPPRKNDAGTKIAEAAKALAFARERLAVEYCKRACSSQGIKIGHQQCFRNEWKEVCNIIEAKFGADITFEALRKLQLSTWC